jgi:transaldolase/glucose-6-phosphate isomerase
MWNPGKVAGIFTEGEGRMVRMKSNPLHEMANFGQSPWVDFLDRGFVTSGTLARLASEDGIKGVTSNPTIFEKALSKGEDYEEQIRRLAGRGARVREVYREIVAEDVRQAADVLRPLYDATKGVEGYVSLEADPDLSYDTARTVARVIELLRAVGRPNVFLKIAATDEGIPAIEECVSLGIPVNATLIFSVRRYEEIAHAYFRGIERMIASGQDPRTAASVASVFVSRTDALVDRLLDEIADRWAGTPKAKAALSLKGKAGIANARLAYARFRDMLATPRWRKLEKAGARIQRPLWGSTGTKNPAHSDVTYVEELIGPDTVNTMPPATLSAFRDHGKVADTLTGKERESRKVLAGLESLGIRFDEVCRTLEREGVEKFVDSYERLLATVDRRLRIRSAA